MNLPSAFKYGEVWCLLGDCVSNPIAATVRDQEAMGSSPVTPTIFENA